MEIYNLLRFEDPDGLRPPHYFRRETLDHVLGTKQLHFTTRSVVWPNSRTGYDYTEQIDVPKLAKRITKDHGELGITAKKVVMVDLEDPETWWPWTWSAVTNWLPRVNPVAMARQIRLLTELRAELPDYRFGCWGFPPPVMGGSLYTSGPKVEAAFWQLNREFQPLADACDVFFPPIYLCSKKHRQYLTLDRALMFVDQLAGMCRLLGDQLFCPVLWHEEFDTWQKDRKSGVDNREKQLKRQWLAEYYGPLAERCLDYGGFVAWSEPAVKEVFPIWHWDDDWVRNGLLRVLN